MAGRPPPRSYAVRAVLSPAILAVAVLFLVPLFDPVLARIGAPSSAWRLLEATHRWWWLLPLGLFLLVFHTRWGAEHAKRLADVSGGITLGLAAFVVWACYGPVLALVRLAG
jgi:hypothetical protein